MTDEEDRGGYYVTGRDQAGERLLAGPFDTHEEALEYVAPAWSKAQELDPGAFLWNVRTVRVKDPSQRKPGALNLYLGVGH